MSWSEREVRVHFFPYGYPVGLGSVPEGKRGSPRRLGVSEPP